MSILLSGCGRSEPPASPPGSEIEPDLPAADDLSGPGDGLVVVLSPGPDMQTRVQEELILAEPGTVIQLEEGVFEFSSGLSLDVDHVTLRGRGMDKTILSFKRQDAGAEGLYITSDHVLIEDLAIEDTRGNGLKAHSADHIVLRRVRAEWTGGPKETNGAYGIYPVSSQHVLIEECVAIGGSDSGIYVGQSQNIIVRNCRAEYNVAGIEIENCHGADVYGNTATHNTGGILVFDLPDLPQQRGHNIRVFRNRVVDNNTPNFAPKGNIVGTVAPGTGILLMANANVEIFGNDIRDHGTTSLLMVSYFSTGIDIKDPAYYPYPEGIHVHQNQFGAAGDNPRGETGEMIALTLGTPVPDIVWDGVTNPERRVDGVLPREARIYIHDNAREGGELRFGNMGGVASLADPSRAQVKRDLTAHAGELPPVPAIRLEDPH